MPAIKKELERITEQHTEDIADGAGVVAKTNPPRVLNIAMAISGGRTLNIAKACDIFYGNDPADSQTITEAIARGVKAGSPYDSIDAILRAVEGTPKEKQILPTFFETDLPGLENAGEWDDQYEKWTVNYKKYLSAYKLPEGVSHLDVTVLLIRDTDEIGPSLDFTLEKDSDDNLYIYIDSPDANWYQSYSTYKARLTYTAN